MKYGLNFRDDEQKGEKEVIKREQHNIPLFYVALDEKELSELLANMNWQIEGEPTKKEIEIFNKILESFEEQIKMLEKIKNKIPNSVLSNIESFKGALERMKRFGAVAAENSSLKAA